MPLNREAHIRRLAKTHGITVERCEDRDAEAFISERRILVPRDLTTDENYLAALHEIGHVVMGDLWYPTKGEQEFVAWAWAFNHARDVEWSVFRRKWECFETYLVKGHSARYQMPAPTFAHRE